MSDLAGFALVVASWGIGTALGTWIGIRLGERFFK